MEIFRMTYIQFMLYVDIFLLSFKQFSAGELSIYPDIPIKWIIFKNRINITCKYRGPYVQNVHWEVNGSTIEKRHGTTWTNVIGRMYNESHISVTFHKKHAGYSDSGNYTCRAGRASRSLKVKVTKGRLKIRPNFGKIIVTRSSPITLVCKYEGKDELPVTWYKGSSMEEHFGFLSQRWTVRRAGVSSTFEISKQFATDNDSTEYTCVAGPYKKSVTVQVSDVLCHEDVVHKYVSDEKITASSHYQDTLYFDGPSRSKLNTTRVGSLDQHPRKLILGGAWQAKVSDKKPWVQVEFPTLTIIKSIATQGRSSFDCCNQSIRLTAQSEWVTSYIVQFSKDGKSWEKYRDLRTGDVSIFPGNTDQDTIVKHKLPVPVVTRYMRIDPHTWHRKTSMRLGASGCVVPSSMEIVHPVSDPHSRRTKSKFHITCKFSGPHIPDVRWLKDEKELTPDPTLHTSTVMSQSGDGVTVMATLHKMHTVYSDAGRYSCLEEVSKVRQNVDINLAELDMLPGIQRMWLLPGQRLNVSCHYKGVTERSIKWRKDRGGSILDFQRRLESKRVGHIFSIQSYISKIIEPVDSSNITCGVEGFEQTMEVRVIDAPQNSSVVLYNDGSRILLECDFNTKIHDVVNQVYWTKDNLPLSKVESLTDRYDFNFRTRSLIIRRTSLSDAGHYECNILLDVGTENQQLIAIPTDVYAPPEIYLNGPQSVMEGDSMHIYCKVDGYPVPEISWYRDDQLLPLDDPRYMFQPHSGAPNGHLVVIGVNNKETGRYKCRANEGMFPEVSSQISIKVNEGVPGEGNGMLIAIISGSVMAVLILGLCCVGCFVRVLRSKKHSKDNSSALKSLSERGSSQISKPYVQLHAIDQITMSSSEEGVTFLPKPVDSCMSVQDRYLPRTPDHMSTATFTTFGDGSDSYEKYERPMRQRPPSPAGESMDIR